MGDLFTNGSYPVIDESSGGSPRGMISAVERLAMLADADTVVVPGHGDVADRASMLRFVDMLRTLEDRVLPRIRAGQTASEIIASLPTADFDPVWGQGYVTGEHFMWMVLAALGIPLDPARK